MSLGRTLRPVTRRPGESQDPSFLLDQLTLAPGTYSEKAFKCGDVVCNVQCQSNGEPFTWKSTAKIGSVVLFYSALLIFFVFSGTVNTILFKLQNESQAKGTGTGPPVAFAHPFNQGWQMFLGMTLMCLTSHWVKDFGLERTGCIEKKAKKQPINQLLFLLPATCDFIASTFLYVGLIMTYASVYQMMRATVVPFTAILSIIFLRATIWKYPHKWAGVLLILIGTALVGVSSVEQNQGNDAPDPVLGAGMVIIGQLVYAVQFVFEETFLKGYDTDPMQVPGYEGLWGWCEVTLVLAILYVIPGADFGAVENYPATFIQYFSNWDLFTCVILLIVNIGVYNFTGNVITKVMSAATRCTVDCIRNVIVWVIQIVRGRQDFAAMQLGGFIILVCGTFVYNEVGFGIIIPFYQRWVNKMKEKDAQKEKEREERKERERLQKEQKRRGGADPNQFAIMDGGRGDGPIQEEDKEKKLGAGLADRSGRPSSDRDAIPVRPQDSINHDNFS